MEHDQNDFKSSDSTTEATRRTSLILVEVASLMPPGDRLRDHRGMTEYEGLESDTSLLRITAFRVGQLRESKTKLFRPIIHESAKIILLPLVRLGRGALAGLLVLPQIWWVAGYIRRTVERPVIYLLSYHISPAGRLLSRILDGAPIVLRQQVEIPQRGLGHRLNLAALQHADLVLAVSEGIRKQIIGTGFDPRRVVVRHAAINSCFVRAPEMDRNRRDVRSVAFIGRLEKEKGPLAAIRAFEMCAQAHPELHLEVIGSGSLEDRVKVRIRQSPFRERMSWIPRADPEALALRLDELDVVLMPSETEGFGRIAVESMLRGCVVVGYRTGGLPEACGPGGLLVEPGSVDGLAVALDRLITDPIELQRLRALGSQHAHEVYEAAATPVTTLIRRTLRLD